MRRFSLTTNKVLTSVIVLALLIFISILFLLIRETNQAKTTAAAVAHTQEVLLQDTKVLAGITDIETGSRGFVLTGNETFLEPMKKSRMVIQDEINSLYELTKNNPVQQHRVDSVLFYTNKRILYSENSVKARKEKGLDEAIRLIASGEGKLYMDHIRRLLGAIETEENKLLQQRKAATIQSDQFQNGIIFILIFISIALMIVFLRKDQFHIAAQKKAEKHFKLLTNALNEYAIYMLDPNGIVLSWSTSAMHIKGYTEEEIIGKNYEIFFTAADKEKGEPARNMSMAKESGSYQTEGMLVRKDGSTFWADVVFTALKDEHGVLYGYSKITRDITERKKAQQELEFLSLQISQAHDAIYVVDAHLKIKNWNHGAEKLYGFTKEEVLDKKSNDLLATDMSEEEINKAVEEINEKDYWTGEIKRKTKNGDHLYIHSSTTAIRDANRNIAGYIAVGIDVTPQKKLQNEIAHLANIVEKSSEAIISISLDFKIISWNEGAEKLHGYTKEEVIGKTSFELGLLKISPAEAAADLQELFEKGGLKSEMDFYRKDGSSFFGALSANPIRNEQGVITSIFFIVKDISLRKQLEEQLKKNNEELEEKVRLRTEQIESSEKRYRYLFENNPMPMWVIDLEDFRFLDVNKMAVLQYGYSREEFLAMSATDIRPEEDRETFVHSDHAFVTDATNYNRGVWRHRKKDRTVILVEIFAHEIMFEGRRARFILSNDITEKKIAEEKLMVSEERFRRSMDAMLEGVQIIGFDWRYIYVNDSMAKHGKHTKEELIGHTVMEMYPGIEQTGIYKVYEQCYNDRIAIHLENEFVFPDQSSAWFELSFQPVPEGIFILSVDITDRKKAEAALKSSEEHYRTLIDQSADGIFVSDRTGRYIDVNIAGCKITGYSREELLLMNIADLLAEEEQQRLPGGIGRLAAGNVTTSEWMFKRKDGSAYVGEITARELPGQKRQAILRDVTQRRAAQEALSRSEKLYRSLFENMLHGFTYCKAIFVDGIFKDYIYLAVNNEYETLLGLKNIVGKKISEVAPGLLESDSRYAAIVGRVLQSGIPEKFESYAAPLGKWIAVSIYSPEKGYFVGLVDNITERKLAEEKIKQINVELEDRVIKRTDQLRKTNEELEAFSYSVSHDLRAPLRAIIGFTAILEEDYSNQLDNEARRITGIIKNNTVKMGNLIDDLLSFSRMGRQDVIKTAIDFTSLVDEIVESIDDKENGHNKITWHIHPLPVVKADINTMRQVWINLISNAVKYSAKTKESVVEIGAFNENGHVIFYVKDNGIGFDEKYKNKLFKVFQRLHSSDEFEGTGIGLAIVEKIVSKHGGEVWAEAVLNEGATFYFSLPEKEPEIV